MRPDKRRGWHYPAPPSELWHRHGSAYWARLVPAAEVYRAETIRAIVITVLALAAIIALAVFFH